MLASLKRKAKAALMHKRLGEPETAKIVHIVVALLILAVLFPIAMQQISTTSTTGWASAVATVFTVLVPVLAIIGVALMFFRGEGRRGISSASVVHVVIALLLLAILFPVAMGQIANACSGASPPAWCSQATGVIFTTLAPVLAIIGVALFFVRGVARR